MASADSSPTRANFTAARVRSFACPPGQAEKTLWDATAPGLGLRATRGGSKVYIFQFRLHGKAGRVRLGNPGAWDIDQARAEARRLKVLVDRGIDPRDEKRAKADAHAAKEAEAVRQAVTLGEAWDRYVQARRADWSPHHLADHVRAMQVPGLPRPRSRKLTVAGGLYPLRDTRLADLSGDVIEAWVKEESSTRPTVTRRNYRLLRAFLGWASTQPDLRNTAPAESVSAANVRRALPKSTAKSDALQREQLADWFAEVRKIHNPVIAAYLQTVLLTGARREEIAGLRWEDVDFQWKALSIRDKVEGARVIPLPPYVASLLVNLPRRNEWVFSSPTARNGRIQEPRIQHNKALVAAGLPHVTVHGLRRSFGSLSEWVEMPTGIVAQIMGHKPSATAEKHYRVRPLDLLRMWHTRFEGWVLEQAGIEQPAVDTVGRSLRVVK